MMATVMLATSFCNNGLGLPRPTKGSLAVDEQNSINKMKKWVNELQ